MVAYHPTDLTEALACLGAQHVVPIAGGTDWMIRPDPAQSLVFLNKVEGLSGVTGTDGGVSIGAATTYTMLLQDPLTPPMLREAVRGIAAPAIRNLGTIGGNIVNASPAGDTLPALYALGAALTLRRADSSRTLPIERFITGVKRTRLLPGELLTRIDIPAFVGDIAVEKVGARRAQAISKCSLAAAIRILDGAVADVRVAFGAAAPTVVRDRALEASICGLPVFKARARIPALVAAYAALLSPIDDARSTAGYRRAACLNLLEGFLSDRLIERSDE